MNKEQIEKIALEVANETIVHIAADAPSSKYQIVQFATCFLARVDAERAKEEPVAWRQETRYLEPFYFYHETEPARGKYEPLYLHLQPIPEGYKLVPDAVISSFPEINPSNYNHEDVCALNDWGTQLVLATSSEVKP